VPELQRLVVTHIHDLIAAIVGATRDARAIAEGRGIRAARLHAVMADITANLADCGLTVAGVATRQRVSPRYSAQAFRELSAFVLGQRLSRAHRMLSDARLAHRSISLLAFGVGFSDLSYFNRAFRRRYDATPSEIRESTHRSDSKLYVFDVARARGSHQRSSRAKARTRVHDGPRQRYSPLTATSSF
jgi:AraC-like DNA-binding protein